MTKYLNALARNVHTNAKAKGLWEKDPGFPEIAALIHREISEALQEYRDGRKPTDIYGKHEDGAVCIPPCSKGLKPEGIPIELADAILVIMSYAAHVGIDLDEAIRVKMAYNATRPHRHGGKLA